MAAAQQQIPINYRADRRQPSIEAYAAGIRAGNRAMLGRAITLVESNLPHHMEMAQELLTMLLPETGKSIRIGLTGVPGAGKSLMVEALGCRLTREGKRVAVLAIDPSSQISGGSILGDKTRMTRLSAEDNAFIRPSPSGGSLGGVARKTREAMLLCEAAGYDVVLIETVGVGQSETVVGNMVDFFIVLAIPGAGDELQGIKRGVLELADLIAVNKADGDNVARANLAAQQFRNVLRFMRPHNPYWSTAVTTCSALKGTGIEELWQKALEFRERMQVLGKFEETRRGQLVRWMWGMIEEDLMSALRQSPNVRSVEWKLRTEVLEGRLTPTLAARRVVEAFAADLREGNTHQ